MGLFGKKEAEENLYTEEQVRAFVENALQQEKFDFSALWEEQTQDTGILAKLAPLIGMILSVITIILVVLMN